jgi:hypothetical protein
MAAALAWCGKKHQPVHFRLGDEAGDAKTFDGVPVVIDTERKPALVLADGRTIDLIGCAARKVLKDARK